MPEIPPFPPYPGPSAGDQIPPPFPAYPGPSEPQHFQNLVNAVTQVESGGSSTARSPKGAFGAMQVMPATGREMGVTDINNPVQMKAAGEKYLGKLITRYQGDTDKATAAYNWGPTRVDSLVKRKGDDWYQHLPSMVKDYMGKVASFISPASAEAATTPDRSQLTDEQLMARIAQQQKDYAAKRPRLSDEELMARIAKQQQDYAAKGGPSAPDNEWDVDQQGAAAPAQPGLAQRFLNAVGANPTQNYLPGPIGSQQVGQEATEGIIGVPGQHMEAIGSGIGGIAGGAAFGFPGAAAGSIAGSALGALGDQYFFPREGETLGEHVLGAAGRGALAAGAGELVRRTIGGIANLRYGEGPAITKPEVGARAARFERQGIENVTPSVLTQSGSSALKEHVAQAGIYGGDYAQNSIRKMTEQGQAAIQKVNGQVIPNIGNDYEALGQGLIASAENHKLAQLQKNVEAFREPARAFVKGELTKQAQAEAAKVAQEQGPYAAAQLYALRQQGIKAANVTFDVMNNIASHENLRGPTTNMQEAVEALRRTSSRSSQFNARINQIPGGQAPMINGMTAADMEAALPKNFDTLKPTLQDAYIRQLTGLEAKDPLTMLPAHLQKPPAGATGDQYRLWSMERRQWLRDNAGQQLTSLDDAFKEMGFNPNAREMTFDQIRHQATNNLTLARTSTNPQTKIAAQRLGEAARKDLDNMLLGNQEAQNALAAAHQMYKSEYLDIFVNSPEAAELAKHDPSDLVKQWFDKDISIEGMRRMDKLVGPDMAKTMQMAKMQKLVTDSVNPNDTDMFSIPIFLDKIRQFKPGVLEHTYGKDFKEFADVIRSLNDIKTMYKSALNASGTGKFGQAHAQMVQAAKLVGLATLGFGGAMLGHHVSLPLNPLMTAAFTVGVPTVLSRLWFTPKYLKFWTEGLKIDPTKRNAAMLINRWGTKLAAAYAQDMIHNAGDGNEVIPIIPPKGGTPEGGISIIPPGR